MNIVASRLNGLICRLRERSSPLYLNSDLTNLAPKSSATWTQAVHIERNSSSTQRRRCLGTSGRENGVLGHSDIQYSVGTLKWRV